MAVLGYFVKRGLMPARHLPTMLRNARRVGMMPGMVSQTHSEIDIVMMAGGPLAVVDCFGILDDKKIGVFWRICG